MNKRTPVKKVDDHTHSESDRHGTSGQANPFAGALKKVVKGPGPSLDTGGGNDPHDGRVHAGFSGDNGDYVSTDSTGTASSAQPGRNGNLGAQTLPIDAQNDAADRKSVPQRRNAKISSSRRTDRSDGDNVSVRDDDGIGQEDGDYTALENVNQAELPIRSGASTLEQPSGDGNYQKAADRTVSNADDTESERD